MCSNKNKSSEAQLQRSGNTSVSWIIVLHKFFLHNDSDWCGKQPKFGSSWQVYLSQTDNIKN